MYMLRSLFLVLITGHLWIAADAAQGHKHSTPRQKPPAAAKSLNFGEIDLPVENEVLTCGNVGPAPSYPALTQTALFALLGGVFSAAILGRLAGRLDISVALGRSMSVPVEILVALLTSFIWAKVCAHLYPIRSDRFPTREEVASLLAVIVFPVALAIVHVMTWLTSRSKRSAESR